MQQNNAVQWVHADVMTKSQRLTDQAGNVVSAEELDPWGGYTNRYLNRYLVGQKFTSYIRDANGADEAQHRRYNRWWSRFDQPDPYDGSYSLGDPQSFNRYAYVQNDPVNFTDPTGLFALVEKPDYSALWSLIFARWEMDRPLVQPEMPIDDGGIAGGAIEPPNAEPTRNPCDISDIVIPAGVSVNANISEATKHHIFTIRGDATRTITESAKNVGWFYNQVRNADGRVDDVRAGRSWDYKQLGAQYEAFGNFNYGATGAAAGFTDTRLLREAGRAQVQAKTSRPEWGYPGNVKNPWGGKPPYGDDPRDQELIKRGIAYWEANCYTL